MLGYDVNNTKGRIAGDSIRENREGLVGSGKARFCRQFDNKVSNNLVIISLTRWFEIVLKFLLLLLSDRHIRRVTTYILIGLWSQSAPLPQLRWSLLQPDGCGDWVSEWHIDEVDEVQVKHFELSLMFACVLSVTFPQPAVLLVQFKPKVKV